MTHDPSILPSAQMSLSRVRSEEQRGSDILRSPLENGDLQGMTSAAPMSLLGAGEARLLSAGSGRIQENEGRMPNAPHPSLGESMNSPPPTQGAWLSDGAGKPCTV